MPCCVHGDYRSQDQKESLETIRSTEVKARNFPPGTFHVRFSNGWKFQRTLRPLSAVRFVCFSDGTQKEEQKQNKDFDETSVMSFPRTFPRPLFFAGLCEELIGFDWRTDWVAPKHPLRKNLLFLAVSAARNRLDSHKESSLWSLEGLGRRWKTTRLISTTN